MKEYILLPVFTLFSSSYLIFLSFVSWMAFVVLLNRKKDFFYPSLKGLISWLHAMTFETFIFFGCVVLRPLGYLRNQNRFIGKPQGRPVLLVHGYLHDSSAWIYMKKKLKSEEIGPIYTLNLLHPFRSIVNYSEIVAKKAEKIALDTGRKDLILIGHSMGGLVCSWYATKIAPPSTVTDVITIGSPLKGTYAAYLALGSNGSEMKPKSSFLRELQQEIEQNQNIRFYHIGTKTDQLVIPSSSSWIGDDLERQFVVDDIGHVSLLFSKRVLKKVCTWIKNSDKEEVLTD